MHAQPVDKNTVVLCSTVAGVHNSTARDVQATPHTWSMGEAVLARPRGTTPWHGPVADVTARPLCPHVQGPTRGHSAVQNGRSTAASSFDDVTVEQVQCMLLLLPAAAAEVNACPSTALNPLFCWLPNILRCNSHAVSHIKTTPPQVPDGSIALAPAIALAVHHPT
jgi:hypothetical protein